MSDCEPSKNAEKRGKKNQRALFAVVTQPRTGSIRISDQRRTNSKNQTSQHSNGHKSDKRKKSKVVPHGQCENEEIRTRNVRTRPPSIEPDNEEEQPIGQESAPTRKKKRGPTTMESVIPLGEETKMFEIEFNIKGQPVGPNSDTLVSFLGVLVRQHVPVTMDEWKDLEDQQKTDLWTSIQQIFIVDDVHKQSVFKLMGNYWRTYKSKLTSRIWEANQGQDRARSFALIKPANVKSKATWMNWVKTRLGKEFEEKRKKFSAMRKKQKYTHTLSRKGFARLEYEMKKNHPNLEEVTRSDLWTRAYQKKNGEPVNEAVGDILNEIKKCNESKENPPARDNIRDDALARVLGPETRGRVRGLGFGATPSRVVASIQGSGRVKELESIVKSQSQRMGVIEAQLEAVLKMHHEPQNKNVQDMTSSHACSPQSQEGSLPMQGQNDNLENAKCQLIHWYNFDSEDVVAEGTVASTVPSVKVNHLPIGRDCWKVWVDDVFYENVNLYRPTDDARHLSQALGGTIAWPKSCIKLV